MITLTLKQQPHVPLEAEAISPDVLATRSCDEIRALPMFLGKQQIRLDAFFDVEIDSDSASNGGGIAQQEVVVRGDVSRVKWLGRGMTGGRLRVEGNAGMHLGAFMKGGTIEVAGNAGDWVGGEMKDGLIRVRGNAGGQIGAAYRGSLTGMRGGRILIDGSAGLEVGMRMKRGTIVVQGAARDFAGLEMKGGTIVLGGAELRTGAWMQRGTIVVLSAIPMLPTFLPACSYNPTFLSLYARDLAGHGFSLPHRESEGAYHLYSGDMAVSRKGEILVWQPGKP